MAINHTLFRSLTVPEASIECESFPVISIDLFFLVQENKYYLQVYFYNYAY